MLKGPYGAVCKGQATRIRDRRARLPKKKRASLLWRMLNMRVERILVPHDGEQMSDKALLYAIEIGKGLDAKIILLHVIEEIEVPPTLLLGNDKELIEKAKRSIERELEQKWNKFSQEKIKLLSADNLIGSTEVLKDPDASNAILKYAKEKNVDLIIMGSRRLEGASKFIVALGSVARKVSERASCPVMLIH